MPVTRAIISEFLEVPVLTLDHSHVHEMKEMHRQPGVFALAGKDLENEVVERERSDTVAVHPLCGMDAGTWCGEGVVQLVAAQEHLHVTGAQQDDVTRFNCETSQSKRRIEVSGRERHRTCDRAA